MIECACCGEVVDAVCESGSCPVCLADGIGHGNEVAEWSACEESLRLDFPEVLAAVLAECKSAFLSYPWTIDA
jgi:hypothetical protein